MVSRPGIASSTDPVTSSDHAPYAFGNGSRIVVGDEVASVPDTVHSLHYTSVGVLVRSNPHDGASDGSGPESLTLVRWDGSTKDLGTVPEGVGPATDPSQPYYALAEADGDGFVAVVRDADTGDEVERLPLPDEPRSYWEVPPLGLSGDTLYVGYRKTTAAVDLETGESHLVDGLPGGIPDVSGGRAVVASGDNTLVVDVATGDTVAEIPVAGDPMDGEGGVRLSPDGRFALVWTVDPETYETVDPLQVFDLSTGDEQDFSGDPWAWGWSPDGDLFKVGDGTITTCDAASGACKDTAVPGGVGTGNLRLGGLVYES